MALLILVVYQLLFPLIALAILARLMAAGRGRTLREGAAELRQRLGLVAEEDLAPLRRGGAPVVWFHAASVGEVTAAAPLLRLIAAKTPRPAILLTSSTATGREKARSLGAADCALLAPVDFYPAVRAFLRRARPRALILLETELWPMTICLAHRRGVRLGLANGRISERAFPRYRLLRGFLAPWLGFFERAAVQTEEDARRYASLGVSSAAISISGNTKYDVEIPASRHPQKHLERLDWGENPFWIAASTHRGEEDVLAQAHLEASRLKPSLRWVLAPRHPERSAETERLLGRLNVAFARWSDLEAGRRPQTPPQCLLIDRLGVLAGLYARALAVFVGGSLAPIGGHNLLEPALTSTPVLFGPHTASVRMPASALLDSGGGFLVHGASDIARILVKFLNDAPCREDAGRKALSAARSFCGASERTLAHLAPLIFTDGK